MIRTSKRAALFLNEHEQGVCLVHRSANSSGTCSSSSGVAVLGPALRDTQTADISHLIWIPIRCAPAVTLASRMVITLNFALLRSDPLMQIDWAWHLNCAERHQLASKQSQKQRQKLLRATYDFDQLWHGHLEMYNDRVGHIFHWPYVLVVVGEYDREEFVLCLWTTDSWIREEEQMSQPVSS